MSYEPYNHMTVRPFKGDELMHDEYYNGIHYGNQMSWIILRCDELKLFSEKLKSCVFGIVHK